ncbi:MAG: hypothetical protein RLZZ350_841 [Verrucomicrobiota bacterium]|jgi:hypothetical protein
MNPDHAAALKTFDARVARLLMLRRAVQWTTGWFFFWGAVVLIARISGRPNPNWLLLGIFGFVPLALAAIALEQRRRPQFADVRARYDGLQNCGGLMMSEETADMSAWQAQLPATGAPKLAWRSGRPLGALALAAAFVAVAILLPERLTHFAQKKPLEIGQLVEQLQTEVKTLEQEKILDDKKADDMTKQLAQLKQDSSALDPNKTWEALDHIKESNSQSAKEAAEEALAKISQLAPAESLAAALAQAASQGMDADTATQAAQELAAMINSAKLEDGLLKGELPADLLKNLGSLNAEQMAKLASALKFNKDALNGSISKLSAMKMIDPKYLSQCKGAGQCKNPGALADYLSQCNSTNKCDSACLLAMCLGRGGPGGGGPAAPMTWKDESDESGAKFKEEQLPPGHKMDDAQFVGVSQAAPQLTDEKIATEHGALASTTASGGGAQAQTVLPRHKQAVQNFFKRDEK